MTLRLNQNETNASFLGSQHPPHLTADRERLQRVEAEPPSVPCLFETVHKFCVERPLQGRESHQDDMLLFGGQLVPQDIVTSSAVKIKVVIR